jgi:hypothetical protein
MLLSIRKTSISCRLLLVLCAAALASCSDDDSETPAPETPIGKSILGFAFPDVTPGIAGIVDEAAKTIAVTVPAATDLKALKPTITLSEGSAISPATGVAQDFSKPVIYTVTAGDGATQAYTVTVTAKSLSFTITEADTEVEPGSVFVIRGSGFKSYLLNKVILRHISSGSEVEIDASPASSSDEYLIFSLGYNYDMPMGDYQVTLISGTERVTLATPLKVYTDKLLVLDIMGVYTDAPEYVEYSIKGVNFSANGNKVELHLVGEDVVRIAEIKQESIHSIVLDRTNLPSDYYQVRVSNANDNSGEYYNTVYIGKNPSLAGYNGYSFKLGETLIAMGERLKSDGGRTTRFSFRNRDNGSSMERDAEISADETTASFTFDDAEKFVPGYYEVDFYANESLYGTYQFEIVE